MKVAAFSLVASVDALLPSFSFLEKYNTAAEDPPADWNTTKQNVCPQYTVAVPDLRQDGAVRCLSRSQMAALFSKAGYDFDDVRVPMSLLADVDHKGSFIEKPVSLLETAAEKKKRELHELHVGTPEQISNLQAVMMTNLENNLLVTTKEQNIYTTTTAGNQILTPIISSNEVAKQTALKKYVAVMLRKNSISSYLDLVNARSGLMEATMEVMKELASKRNELDEAQQGLPEMIGTVNDLWNSTMQLMYFLDSPIGGCSLQATMLDSTLSIAKKENAGEPEFFLMRTPDVNPADIQAQLNGQANNGTIAGTSANWATNMQYCGGELSSCGDVIENSAKCTTPQNTVKSTTNGATGFMQIKEGHNADSRRVWDTLGEKGKAGGGGITDEQAKNLQDYSAQAAREIAFGTYVKYQMQVIKMMNLILATQTDQDNKKAQSIACQNAGCGAAGSGAIKPKAECKNIGCAQHMTALGRFYYNNLASCKNGASKVKADKDAGPNAVATCTCKKGTPYISQDAAGSVCNDPSQDCEVSITMPEILACGEDGKPPDSTDCGDAVDSPDGSTSCGWQKPNSKDGDPAKASSKATPPPAPASTFF